METKILILAVIDTTEGAMFESAGGYFYLPYGKRTSEPSKDSILKVFPCAFWLEILVEDCRGLEREL